MKIEYELRAALIALSHSAPPKLAGFARWLLDHLPDVAFHSIRGLAQKAGVDANLVSRLSRELGFDGFDAFRSNIQGLVQSKQHSYERRARALRDHGPGDVYGAVIAASRANMDRVTDPALVAEIDSCIDPLLAARRIYSVGVRSCYAIAHNLAYTGAMAFPNFEQVAAVPGAILDQMSETTPEDIVIAITYEHYSAEVVRACQVALDRGARVLALTDAPGAPVARGAWKVICLPMAGPQLMPSLNSAFLAIEMILAAMAARSPDAADNVARFEDRMSRYGGYFFGQSHPAQE